MTFDNAFANHSFGKVNDSNVSKKIDKQKKRKNIDVENKDTIISKPKKKKTTYVIKMCDEKQKKFAVTVIVCLKI